MRPRDLPNVLASRYASEAMVNLWSPETKVVFERKLWVAVLRAQAEVGLDVPAGAIDDYERVVGDVDLDSIEARERITKHDVKARIEEFSALAGHELIHAGMTSRDLTENVEQLQVRDAMALIRDRAVATLVALARLAVEHAETPMAARSHNVAAQVTTLGKRFAVAGEELLVAFERLESLLERYPLRGIKGPVGTQTDQLDLLGSDDAVAAVEEAVARHLGFSRTFTNVGQVYPRSLDLEVVGVFNSPNPQVNRGVAYLPLDTADELLQMDGAVTHLPVLFPDWLRPEAQTAALNAALGAKRPGVRAVSWKDLARE